jgi:F0F1-type ATP synthase assembly protein I
LREPIVAKKDDDANWGQYIGYGFQICAGVLLGLLVGNWLDKRYHWAPWGLLVGVTLGLTSGMYLLIRDAIRINKD